MLLWCIIVTNPGCPYAALHDHSALPSKRRDGICILLLCKHRLLPLLLRETVNRGAGRSGPTCFRAHLWPGKPRELSNWNRPCKTWWPFLNSDTYVRACHNPSLYHYLVLTTFCVFSYPSVDPAWLHLVTDFHYYSLMCYGYKKIIRCNDHIQCKDNVLSDSECSVLFRFCNHNCQD